MKPIEPEITDEDVYRAAFKKTDDELTTLRTRLQQVESERDKAEARNKEAERLLSEIDDHVAWIAYEPSEKWRTDRDTFLNPKPQDVM